MKFQVLRPGLWILLFGIVAGVAAALAPAAAVAASAQGQTESQTDRHQFRGFLPLTVFYSTPSPLPPGQPGELIRSEEFDEYQLPEGVSAFRILYHSRSSSGGMWLRPAWFSLLTSRHPPAVGPSLPGPTVSPA